MFKKIVERFRGPKKGDEKERDASPDTVRQKVVVDTANSTIQVEQGEGNQVHRQTIPFEPQEAPQKGQTEINQEATGVDGDIVQHANVSPNGTPKTIQQSATNIKGTVIQIGGNYSPESSESSEDEAGNIEEQVERIIQSFFDKSKYF